MKNLSWRWSMIEPLCVYCVVGIIMVCQGYKVRLVSFIGKWWVTIKRMPKREGICLHRQKWGWYNSCISLRAVADHKSTSSGVSSEFDFILGWTFGAQKLGIPFWLRLFWKYVFNLFYGLENKRVKLARNQPFSRHCKDNILPKTWRA